MELDESTVYAASAVTILVVTAVFSATAALRHNDTANRTWAASLFAALSTCTLTALWGVDLDTPRAVLAMLGGSSVFAFGALWAGIRLFAGRRRSLLLVVLAVSVLVAVPSLIRPGQPDLHVESMLRLGAGGAFAWLGAIELTRSPMRQNLNSRILQSVLYGLGAWYVVVAALNAAAVTAADVQPPTPRPTIVALVLVFVVAVICLTALRVERSGSWWSMNDEARRLVRLPVLGAEAFHEDARDRVERARSTREPVGLVLAQIDDLDELNSAFGREAGNTALAHFCDVLRAHAPASALIGHLGAGRFAVMTAGGPSPADLVSSLRIGLVDTPVRPNMEVRNDARFGTSSTVDTAPTLDALLASAEDALEHTHPSERKN